MEMTDQEILRQYLQSKCKTKQVTILAEINCCSKDAIIEILRKNNVTYPPTTGPKTKEEKELCNKLQIPATTVKPKAIPPSAQNTQKTLSSKAPLPIYVTTLIESRLEEIKILLSDLEDEKLRLQAEQGELIKFLEQRNEQQQQ